MLTYIFFIMIFVGVTTALYQVYETHFNINFGNEKKLSSTDKGHLIVLTDKAKIASQTNARTDFDQAVSCIFGPEFDQDIALAAFADEKESRYAAPLLRRRLRLRFNEGAEGKMSGDVKVHHLPLLMPRFLRIPCLRTKLPRINVRGVLITLIIVNCFLVQLLGAMSIYTIHYEVPASILSWLNDPLIVMLSIYGLIFVSYLISKLDMYMHDLYQLGKLIDHYQFSKTNSVLSQAPSVSV